MRIARAARARIHVLHIATAEEIDFLEQHKDVASCEATPHHLTLSADDGATNTDLWLVSTSDGAARKITGNPAYDGSPLYSPDGKYIAYRTQRRPGFE